VGISRISCPAQVSLRSSERRKDAIERQRGGKQLGDRPAARLVEPDREQILRTDVG